MVDSPKMREQAAQYAERNLGQAVPGLAHRIRNENTTADDQRQLQALSHQHPGEAQKIGLVLQVLQAGVQQQVRGIQARTPLHTLLQSPKGAATAAALIRGATDYLIQKGGDPQHHIQDLKSRLSTQPSEKISALFLNLSSEDRDLREIHLQVIARALIDMANSAPTPAWIGQVTREGFYRLKKNLEIATRSTPTMTLPAEGNGNGQAPGGLNGTRRDTNFHTQSLPPQQAALISPLPSYHAQESMESPVSVVGQSPHISQSSQSGDSLGFNFEDFARASESQDPFDAEYRPAPVVSAPRGPLEWYQKENFQVVNDLFALSAENSGPLQESAFQTQCTVVANQILTRSAPSLPSILEEFRRQKPSISLQIMVQSFLSVLDQQRAVLEQREKTEQGFKQTLDSLGKEYVLNQERLQVFPYISQYLAQLEQHPDQIYALLQQLGSQEISSDISLHIIALSSAYKLCDKTIIPDHFINAIQKNIQALEARKELAPCLTSGEKGRENGWKLGRFLAAGGMGTVFLAEEIRFGKATGRQAAVKISQTNDELNKKSFYREARLLAGVKGNHIVQVYDSGETHEENPYIVMEYVEGPETGSGAYDGDSFLDMIRETHHSKQALPYEALSLVAWKLGLGIQEFQEMKIVQRDLKPANFLMTPDASRAFSQWKEKKKDRRLINTLHKLVKNGDPLIKWTDFGLAKKTDELSKSPLSPQQQQAELERRVQAGEIGVKTSFTLTADGDIVGTPGYMPPETAMGEPQHAYTDQFALGIILFQMFSGGEWPTEMPRSVLGLVADGLNLHQKDGRQHYVNADDERIAGLYDHEDAQILPQLMAQMTHLGTAKSRGSIRSIVNTLHALANASSPEARRQQRAEMNLEQSRKVHEREKVGFRKKLAVLGGVAASLLLAGVLYVVNMRPAEHVEFGGQRKATANAVNQALADDGQTLEQLKMLLSRLQKEDAAEPQGYEADSAAGEPEDSQMSALVSSLEGRIKSMEQAAAKETLLNQISQSMTVLQQQLPISIENSNKPTPSSIVRKSANFLIDSRNTNEWEKICSYREALTNRKLYSPHSVSLLMEKIVDVERLFTQVNYNFIRSHLLHLYYNKAAHTKEVLDFLISNCPEHLTEDRQILIQMSESHASYSDDHSTTLDSLRASFPSSIKATLESIKNERETIAQRLGTYDHSHNPQLWRQTITFVQDVFFNGSLSREDWPNMMVMHLCGTETSSSKKAEILQLFTEFRTIYHRYRQYYESICPQSNGTKAEKAEALIQIVRNITALNELFPEDFNQDISHGSFAELYADPRFLLAKGLLHQINAFESTYGIGSYHSIILQEYGLPSVLLDFLEQSTTKLIAIRSQNEKIRFERAGMLLTYTAFLHRFIQHSGMSSARINTIGTYTGSLSFFNQFSAFVESSNKEAIPSLIRQFEETLVNSGVDSGSALFQALEELKTKHGIR